MSKVVIFLADGCEEVEALTIIDVLRRGSVEAIGAAIGSSTIICGSHNIVFNADALLTEIGLNKDDMVVLPGGMGGRNNLYASKLVCSILNQFNKENRLIGAICAAPTVLGRLGILKGRRATCYPGMENELTGAACVNEEVVVDKNIITSQGPATAMQFALKLLEIMAGEEAARSVAKGLLI